jgi:hypothetical protein
MGKSTDFQTDFPTSTVTEPAATAATAATAPAALTDEHQGAGGAYEMVNGQRVLVGRTQAAELN